MKFAVACQTNLLESKSSFAIGLLSLIVSLYALVEFYTFPSSIPLSSIGCAIVALFAGFFARSNTLGRWGMIFAAGS